MWMMEGLTQILAEMLPDGNFPNIVVFTVITSSSVLSVVGVLRHIYTFLCNQRRVQKVESHPVKEHSADTWQPYSHVPYSEDFLFVARLERLAVINLDTLKCNTRNRKHWKENKTPATSVSTGPTCLKCETGMWERHCVYGLCHACCERLGGCQQQGHKHQPAAYNPWPNNWHRSEQIIDLSRLCLRELPPRLGFHHMNAYSLDASNNCLTFLPEHVTLMRGLVSISLRHNFISDIPACFSSLHQLASIDLRNNRLSTFPDTLLELPQLLKLYLDHNSLSQLPDDINRLHLLQCISLGYNDLTSIPDSLFSIHGLKSLSLRGNSQLSVLPSCIGNLVCLQRLDISYCDLRIIPSSLSSCTILRKCNVSFNRLTHLPCEISQCFRLVQLDVTSNRLTFLPATLLFRQGMLSLAASGNRFIQRQKPTSDCWLLVGEVSLAGYRQAPDLSSLAAAAVERYSLDSSKLPLPVQEELSSYSSCYHCRKRNISNSFRVIKFATFAQHHHQLWQQHLVQEYPFLYTFCHCHISNCTPDTLHSCIDSLAMSH